MKSIPSAVVLALLILATSREAMGQDEEATAEQQHQISAGVGMMLCGFGGDWSGCNVPGWLNVPVVWRSRINEHLAAGVGFMVQVFYEEIPVGGGLRGGLKVYAAKDWLYFQLDVFAGYPYFVLLHPGIGHAFKLTDRFALFIENEIILWVIPDWWAFWQPLIGAEVRF